MEYASVQIIGGTVGPLTKLLCQDVGGTPVACSHEGHLKEAPMIVCKLSILLGARRMTQFRLAALTGLHRDTIRKLYRNSWISIRRDALDHICTVLEIQVGELLVWPPEARR